MSAPSNWPLPGAATRFLTPAFMVEKLARHPLTKDCYPTAMGFYPHASGHAMERARHDDNLLIYSTEGRGFLQTDEFSADIEPGQMILLPQGLSHAYGAHAKAPWSIYWVHFQGASTRVFLQYLGYREGQPLVEPGISPTLIGAFTSLMEVRRTGYSTRSFINSANQLRHLLSQIPLEISAHKGRMLGGFELAGVQGFMLENLERSVSLEMLADVANMSKFHFSSRYKELTGYSPIKHFLHMKMEHACHLLDSTDLAVGEIAAQLGYDDKLYFSRLFRKTIGQSPRSYRASIRK